MFFLDIVGLGDGSSLKSADGVSGAILKAARSIFYTFNTLVYKLISFLYQLFEMLAGAQLLDNDTFSKIADKVGLVLGVIMLFRIIINFIQMLVDPDKINDKEMGAIVIFKKVVIVLIMFGISSFFFDSLHNIQDYVFITNGRCDC